MGFSEILESDHGKIIISIIWGLGISALFHQSCKGKNCIVMKAPNPSNIKNKVFQYNDECFQYTPISTKCEKNVVEH